MERIWGGRRLENLFGKQLPPGKAIGESWEIVDRPEAQSVVRQGPRRGQTLHELWVEERAAIFGTEVPDSPRFPILAKLLDARETLSLQVHPSAQVAASLGGNQRASSGISPPLTMARRFSPGCGRGCSLRSSNRRSTMAV